ncbi:MAG: carboxypeptidase regulatory-like domain-containing protein, partial [Acidobacteria bacterium]|nr:carboxypeptidase regulatory-like domain-containing protein [Acidobacteriota bacterium]
LGTRCDGVNVQGFKANLPVRQSDNFGVIRIDHDFGAKWHFNSSYRYYKLTRATNDQVDIGGFFPGDTLGTPASLSNRPQVPWYIVAGLTTNLTSNTTNDLHYSFLRNWWQWGTQNAPPQLPGLGGALEPLGEQQNNVLAPYNVNAQQVRTRFWDGMDHYVRDDITMLHGNHLFSFGGAYQHNYNYHQRTDNGGGINFTTTYQLGDGSGAANYDFSALYGGSGQAESSTFDRYMASMLGIVTDSQVAYTRTGQSLTLNPPLTPAYDQSTIPYYNVYFSDSWHIKPSLTVTYGLGWTLEMPPTEANGKQVILVDSADQPIQIDNYIRQRQQQALQGQVYNPQIGFSLIGNTANSPKYPYDPFYGAFSPRVAVAWNPHFGDDWAGKVFGDDKTVIRAGYGRIFGRLNGVNLVLVPLLGTGLIQAVQCNQVFAAGTCGPGTPTAANAFRIGVDGLVAPIPAATPTLPQPAYPGFNLAASAAAGTTLDPHTRPNVIDSVDLTVQRQLSNRMTLEFGYIGRYINDEFLPIDINAVPYMMTLGGQSFSSAYASLETALGCTTSVSACNSTIPPQFLADGKTANPAFAAFVNSLPQQAFFTSSLNASFCTGNYKGTGGTPLPNCTAALVNSQVTNLVQQRVWSLWTALDKGGTKAGFNFPCSMLTCLGPGQQAAQLSTGFSLNANNGYGNYNGGFVTLRMNDYKGLTLQQNFTYSKALGTGAVTQSTSSYTANDPFNISNMYGLQSWDRKFIYNLFLVYQPPYYKNQQGVLGHLLGGWNFSPIFAAGSGAPDYCNTRTDAQAFGGGDGTNFSDNEQCLFNGKNPGNSQHGNVLGGADPNKINVGTSVAQCTNANCTAINPGGVPVGINMFSNPVAVFDQFYNPILGVNTRDGGAGSIRGLPYWNMDLSVRKNFKITERVNTEFQFLFLNVLNHMQFADPTLSTSTPSTWGVLNTQGNTPRQIEFGLRVNF